MGKFNANNMVNRVCKQAMVSGYIAKTKYVKVIRLQFHAFRDGSHVLIKANLR